MFLFVVGLLILLAAFAAYFVIPAIMDTRSRIPGAIGSTLIGIVAVVLITFSTGIRVENNQGGIIFKKFGPNMAPGQIIATDGEKGPQANVLTPGWHFGYWPWIYTLESVPNMDIPSGMVGVVHANDGEDLPEGEVYAEAWKSPKQMLDAELFLRGTKDGKKGQRGPQLTVLPPGQYRYNPKLFNITQEPALTVKVGEVVVVKANAGEIYDGDDVKEVNGTPIVPNGYRGIWQQALTPNQYYLHPHAFEMVHVKTVNRIYSYTSPSKLSKQDRPLDDNSIGVRTKDGFEFPVDVRVSAKIPAESAPYVVARIAHPDEDIDNDGFDQLENIVILPAVRAIFRNSAEAHGALEYVATRSEIEKSATDLFADRLQDFQIETDGIFVATIGLSKTEQGQELLRTQTDKEVANQEQQTWHAKKEAEVARAESVRAQAEADKEKDKVEAKVAITIATDKAQATIEEATGKAEAAKKQIEAMGGFENYVTVKVAELLVEQWEGKVPEVLVAGEGGGIDTALISKMLKEMKSEKLEAAPQ